MTTQEMTKQEMIMNLREKREEKKKANKYYSFNLNLSNGES